MHANKLSTACGPLPRGARRRSMVAWLCTATLALPHIPASAAAQDDPLQRPAAQRRLAAGNLLTAITRKPDGPWMAVGRHGLVLQSTDGRSWRQVPGVPVSTDLVSVFFVNASHGWAAGHGGVVIATTDGGQHWVRQFDGRKAADALVQFHQARVASTRADPQAAETLRDATAFKQSGPGRPFLSVWFADEKRGYAVGAYHLLFTTLDGGQHWQPRPDLLDNPQGAHLNTVTAIGNDLYIAGEQGLLARFNPLTDRFERIATPYSGSFFGMVGRPGLLMLFGLQGNVFRSTDNGQHWEKIDAGLSGSVTSGTVLADGRVVLASQSGQLALSADGGDHFARIRPEAPTPIYAIAPGSGNDVIAVGLRGVKAIPLQKEP